jgi:DNA-binding transcriptional MerR regulator
MEGFTAEQASRFTGSTAHQLRYWDRIDLVRPSVQRTGGRPGVRRVYSFRDLVALKMVRSLLNAGMSLQQVRRAFTYLRKKERLEEHLSAVKLMSDGASIYAVGNSEGLIYDALREGQMAFFTTIEDLVKNADGRVPGYLYDRERFIAALNEVEANLQQEEGAPREPVDLRWTGVSDRPAVLRVEDTRSVSGAVS